MFPIFLVPLQLFFDDDERNSERGECMDGFTFIYIRNSRCRFGFSCARCVRVGKGRRVERHPRSDNAYYGTDPIDGGLSDIVQQAMGHLHRCLRTVYAHALVGLYSYESVRTQSLSLHRYHSRGLLPWWCVEQYHVVSV